MKPSPSDQKSSTCILRGNFPVLATAWTDEGEFDEPSQDRLIDWLIDSGVHGLTLLANGSEADTMSDAMRLRVLKHSLERINGRVPTVAGVSHFSAAVAAQRATQAEDLGASCVMSMPPFFGNWAADPSGCFAYFDTLSSAVKIPVMVQDHEVSGVAMDVDFLAKLARELENVRYFKIEFTQTPSKIEKVLRTAGTAVDGVFGGTSGAYFIDEFDRGACGTMPACYMPSVFTRVYSLLSEDKWERAYDCFSLYLPLIHFELRMAGRSVRKAILKYLGIISSERIASPGSSFWDEGCHRQLMRHVLKCDPGTFGLRRGSF